MTSSLRPARRLVPLSCALAASALALTACGGGTPAASTSPAPSTSAAAPSSSAAGSASGSTSAGASTSTSTSGSASSSSAASSSGAASSGAPSSSALSLSMPESLASAKATAIRDLVQKAAGEEAEVSLDNVSPLEYATEQTDAAKVMKTQPFPVVAEGEKAPELTAAQQTCVDAFVASAEKAAESGAAATRSTAMAADPSTPEAQYMPVVAAVTAYPSAEAAAAAFKEDETVEKACAGTELPLADAYGKAEQKAVEGLGQEAWSIAVPGVHGLAVLDGEYIIGVTQMGPGGESPADAEKTATDLAKEILSTLG